MVFKIAMDNNSMLSANGYSIEEQEEIYSLLLKDIFNNPRWYLDHLEKLRTFRVSWHNYKSVKNIGVSPRNVTYSAFRERK